MQPKSHDVNHQGRPHPGAAPLKTLSDGMHNASMSHDYRPGDVLLLECPFTETAVTGVTRYYVSVQWPWLEVDPQAENIRWNGRRALPTPAAREWLALTGFDPLYGARPLRRLVQASIGDKLARALLAGEVHDGDTAIADLPPSKDALEIVRAATPAA